MPPQASFRTRALTANRPRVGHAGHALIGLLALLCAASLAAQPKPGGLKVVASTSWVGAIALAAGARDVEVLAPFELAHPPEYEPKPSDLKKIAGADFLVYSGYERFAPNMAKASDPKKTLVLKVYTDNLPSVLISESRRLAKEFGTEAANEAWIKDFELSCLAMRDKVQAAYPDRRVIAHQYLKTYAEWLGFEVVGVFGPGEPSPAKIVELSKLDYRLIIDNYHNPSAKALASDAKALASDAKALASDAKALASDAKALASDAKAPPRVELINFPGLGGSRSIEDVFAYNLGLFLKAAPRP